jgi:hypothetical protein
MTALRLAALALLFSASAIAHAAGTSGSNAMLDISALAKSFLPTKLQTFYLGSEPDVGSVSDLRCAESLCVHIPHGPDEQDLPDFLTKHEIQLKQGGTKFTLQCNAAGPLVCHMQESRVLLPAGLGVSGGHYFDDDALFIPGDGCLYTAKADHADHVVRRKFCWQAGALREQEQPLSYVGQTGVAQVQLNLYSAPKAGRHIHSIAKNRFVEILVSQPRTDNPAVSAWLLVRDEFGITGWVSVAALGGDNSCLSGRPLGIRGFCATGD